MTRPAKRGEAFSARQSTTFHQPREPFTKTLSTNLPLLFFSRPLSLSLSFTHLYLYTVTNFSYDRLLFPTPLPNSDSVRKFSFGSRPVFHLKQPTNRPTYDFTLYFPSFSLRARAFFATSPLYLSISLFSPCPSLLHPPPSSRPNSQDKFRDCR